ncbi:uncharacterized protein LOC143918540 isoform X2 [Arctopsyche grandis]
MCDYGGYCLKLAKKLKETSNDFDVVCAKGRQGSFEVVINDVPVYSKLQTMALPDYDEVVKVAVAASEGGPITQVKVEQPITCTIS